MASNNSDPAPLKRGVEVSNKLDNDTTTIRVVYTHRPGLHADLAVCVDGQKFLRILRSEVTRHGHLRVHRFWVVDVVTHKKLPHALLTPLSLSVRDAVVDPGIWARWFGVENAKRRAAIDHENENRGDKGVGATLTIPVDAVPSALRDLALCALAKGVDFDELRSGVPRQSHDGHLQFHVEVSLRCGDGDDAGLGTRCAFPKSNDCVPILVLRRDYYLCRLSARNYSYTLRKTDTFFYLFQVEAFLSDESDDAIAYDPAPGGLGEDEIPIPGYALDFPLSQPLAGDFAGGASQDFLKHFLKDVDDSPAKRRSVCPETLNQNNTHAVCALPANGNHAAETYDKHSRDVFHNKHTLGAVRKNMSFLGATATASDAARFELEQHLAAVDKILREQTDFHDLLPSFFLLSQ